MDISGAGLYCAAKAAIDSKPTGGAARMQHALVTNANASVGLSGTWHSELAPFGINTTSIQVSFPKYHTSLHRLPLSPFVDFYHSTAWHLCHLSRDLR